MRILMLIIGVLALAAGLEMTTATAHVDKAMMVADTFGVIATIALVSAFHNPEVKAQ